MAGLAVSSPALLLRRNSHAFLLPQRPCRLGSIIASVGPITHKQTQETQSKSSTLGTRDASWRSFADSVSGEWDGYGADFSKFGSPRELPQSVVPDAFREWDVQLYDWQTQCPTIADESLQYKLIRLLPTVGCEADASTQYSFDEREAGFLNSGAQFLAYHANGSYVALWPGKRVLKEDFQSRNSAKFYVCDVNEQNTFEIEHCLIEDGATKFRVRILQRIVMKTPNSDARGSPAIENITIQREKWESEFRNGEVLGGCATSGTAFAASAAVQESEIVGDWHFENFTCESQTHLGGIGELVYSGSGKEKIELSADALPLPKGVWSEMKELVDGHFYVSVGWLSENNQLISSICEISNDGKAKRACIKFGKRPDEKL